MTFQIDGQTLQEVNTGSYYYTFHTDLYTPGWHELSAVGRTKGGAILTSNVARYQFLSRAEANRILFPFAGAILIIISMFLPKRALDEKPEKEFSSIFSHHHVLILFFQRCFRFVKSICGAVRRHCYCAP